MKSDRKLSRYKWLNTFIIHIDEVIKITIPVLDNQVGQFCSCFS